jgi:hypothetical protein
MLANSHIADPRLARFRGWLANTVPMLDDFVIGWFDTVYKRAALRRGFGGNLSAYIWNPGHPWFTETGRGWAEEWARDPAVWDALMEAIGANRAN